MDFETLSQNFPEKYQILRSKVSTKVYTPNNIHHYYSVVRKQGSWFSKSYKLLVIQHKTTGKQYPTVQYQPNFNCDEQLNFIPPQFSIKSKSLIDLKMLVRFVEEQDKPLQWNLQFSTVELAQEWERLFLEKRKEAKRIKMQQKDKDNLIKDLIEEIKKLEVNLAELKLKCNNLAVQNQKLKKNQVNMKQSFIQYQKDFTNEKEQKMNKIRLKTLEDHIYGKEIGIICLNNEKWKECFYQIEQVFKSYDNNSKESISLLTVQEIQHLKSKFAELKKIPLVASAKEYQKSVQNKEEPNQTPI